MIIFSSRRENSQFSQPRQLFLIHTGTLYMYSRVLRDDMSKQSFAFLGEKKAAAGDEDEDQRPVRPSSSDPSPSKSAGKKDHKFQQVWLEKYRWLRFQKNRMSICDGLKFVIWERNNHVSIHRVLTVITFSLLL